MGTVEQSLRRGADITDIVAAIVREGDIVQGMIERGVKWYIIHSDGQKILGPFTSESAAQIYAHKNDLFPSTVTRIFPPS